MRPAPRISTAVTTLVFTPVVMWTLTQSCSTFTTPYLWSNQRTNRDVADPDESAANAVSTADSGRAPRTIIAVRMSVTSARSR